MGIWNTNRWEQVVPGTMRLAIDNPATGGSLGYLYKTVESAGLADDAPIAVAMVFVPLPPRPAM